MQVTCQIVINAVRLYRVNDTRWNFVCLCELMLYVLVNSHGHVGMLPLFYGTCTQNEIVMTSNKCFKYNHPSKPEKGLIHIDGLTLGHFSWACSDLSG